MVSWTNSGFFQKAKKSRYLVLTYFILLNLIVTADLGLDAPLIVKLVEHYGKTDFEFALYGILPFTLLTGIFGFVWGYISDKYPRRNILSWNLALGGFCMLIVCLNILFGHSFSAMVSFRVMSAVGFGAVSPVSISMVVDLVPEHKRSEVFGWLGIAGVVGTGLGFLLSGSTLHYGLWIPYLIGAIFSFLFLLLLFFIEEPKRGGTESSLTELIQSGQLDYHYRIDFEGLKKILSSSINQWMLFFSLVFTIPTSSLGIFFIPFLVRNHNFSEFFATLYMLIIFSTEILGQVFFGRIGDRFYERNKNGRVKIMFLSLCLALPFAFFAFTINFSPSEGGTLLVFSGLILLFGFFIVGPNPNVMSTFCDINLPEHRGTIMALNGIAWILARSIGAPLCSGLANYFGGNYGRSFQMIMMIYIIALVCLIPVFFQVKKELYAKEEILKRRAMEKTKNLEDI